MRGIGTHIKYIGRSDLNSFKSNGVLPASPMKSRIKFGVSFSFGRAIDFFNKYRATQSKVMAL